MVSAGFCLGSLFCPRCLSKQLSLARKPLAMPLALVSRSEPWPEVAEVVLGGELSVTWSF